jgi:hypothetical protein
MSAAPDTALDRDARAWCAVQLAGRPLVPAEVRAGGPRGIVAVALSRLMDMRRKPGRVIYRKAPPTEQAP